MLKGNRQSFLLADDVVVILPPVIMAAYSASMRSFLFSIQAMLEKDEIRSCLLDFSCDSMGFEKFYKEVEADLTKKKIFVVAVFFNNWKDSFRILEKIALARASSEIKTICVGPYAAFFYEVFLNKGWADIIVLADAEFVVLKLLKSGLDFQAIAKISNIAYKEKGKVYKKKVMWTDRLDEVPFLSPYFIAKAIQPVTVLISRGCPFPCAFCDKRNLWGSKVRFRSIKNVLEELQVLEDAAVRDIVFGDDNLLFDSLYIKSLCRQMIRRGMHFSWKCDSRVDAVTLEVLKLMRMAGCRMICFGVESGSSRIRRNLGKYISNKDIINAVSWAREAGLHVGLYMLLGSPGDSVVTLKETELFLRKLAPVKSVLWHSLVLVPGSRLYDEYILKHKKKKDFILTREQPVSYRQDFPEHKKA
ncbi:MAG: radical SAM protein [Candidatus Omnitrophota bacterium]